jgi:iron complex outermembrane receptor protein
MTSSFTETTGIGLVKLIKKWGGVAMRISLALALCCLCTLSLAADPAHASIRKDPNIPAEPLGAALQDLAKAYDLQLLYHTELAKDLRSPGASGALTSDEAITKVLNGTGLTYKFLDASTITVYPTSESSSAQNASSGSPDDANTSKEAGKKTSQDFRVAQVGQGSNSQSSSVANKDSSSALSGPEKSGLNEIIVTAQKREERLQDVPMALTAISAQSLVDQNQLHFQDYFSDFPGLSFSSGDRGDIFMTIRGLGAGLYTTNTVGIVVDDIPYGASAGNFFPAPDIDPSDLESIEVLRGPQGTLYGASSVGGLIKYVTANPSTDAISGRLETGVTSVYNGNGLGYEERGSINLPVSSTLAFRVSAFTQEDPGYIDNPIRGLNGVNEDHASGGHFAALWSPSETFSLKLSALIQHTDSSGSNYVTTSPPFSGLQQNFLPGTMGYDKWDESFGATMKMRLGNVEVTSLTGYSDFKHDADLDASLALGPLFDLFYNVSGAKESEDINLHKISEELRFSSSIGEHIDWVLGGFYTHESNLTTHTFSAINTDTLATAAVFEVATYPWIYEEYSAFADVTFHVTSQFDVQVGGRQAHDQQPSPTQVTTAYYPSVTTTAVTLPSATENPSTYLFSPQFKFSHDLMAYVRLASGFQAGGPNLVQQISGTSTTGATKIPPTFAPNTTQDYEVGLKGSFLERTVSFDAALYRMNWKNVPFLLTVPDTVIQYTTNAGKAKSQGVELSVEARPMEGLRVAGWVNWDDAALTTTLPESSGLYGVPGSSLPYSIHFSGNLSVEEQFPLVRDLTGFVGGILSYVGQRTGDFTSTPVRQIFPAYAKTDLRAGLKYDSWTLNLFVNNVTDKRGEVGGGLDAPLSPPETFIYIQPRTIGLSVAKSF